MQKKKQIESPADTLPTLIQEWINLQREVLRRPGTLPGIRTAVYHEAVRIRQTLLKEAERAYHYCEELKIQEHAVDHAKDVESAEKIYGA